MNNRFFSRRVLTGALLAGAVVLGWVGSASAQTDAGKLTREDVWRDPEIPVLGSAEGDVTVVEYFDYQCPICKQVHPHLSRAVRDDGKVRLIPRSWPIFGAVSVYAARIALPAKYQGKFIEAHEALITAKVALTEKSIANLLSKAGVDFVVATRDLQANQAAIDDTLKRNTFQAAALGFLGTPAFIVGTFRVEGGLDANGFKRVIADARALVTKE